MSEKWMHEYFNHKSSKWTIMSFLDECKAKSFPDKIGQYLTSLEAITKNESVVWQGPSRSLSFKSLSQATKPVLGHK
ncbi:hypothetical protein RhiirA5_429060 [Rhizophagus irregularis]|uniref:Uncharacterized protein n=1 Tax=Rhizophagus irregularis TaxID=588596 RepID=A0A2N0R362_9GLOM|nr:hypothetical protein RhiirA5_429060 [Rhizophagus irregularis]PKC57753.1 hypothetical protein RhiirA1_472010 [Rhizophagus irregularis]